MEKIIRKYQEIPRPQISWQTVKTQGRAQRSRGYMSQEHEWPVEKRGGPR